MTTCSWCGIKIQQTVIPKCRKCNLPVCSPYLRDCAYEHWRVRHARRNPRRVEDVRTTEAV